MQKVDFSELELAGENSETQYWQGQPFTGIASVLRPDGTLWGDIEYTKGRRFKIIHERSSPGQIKRETIYRDVLRSDGSLRDEIEDKDALRPKVIRRWHESGQREYEAFYDKGTLYGPNRSWDEAGRLRQETIFEYNFSVWMRMWDEAGRLTYNQRLDPNGSDYFRLQEYRERYDKHLNAGQKAWVRTLAAERREEAEIIYDPLLH